MYLAINFAGMYTKYLTDRGQRLAFIETHKAMENKKDSEKEYQRTQKLLDSSEYGGRESRVHERYYILLLLFIQSFLFRYFIIILFYFFSTETHSHLRPIWKS